MITTLMVLAMSALLQADAYPRVLDKGDQSNMDDGREAVARTAAEWNALWRLHAPDRPQPKVDFGRELVAAVFLGSRPTAGFAIDIVGTKEDAGALVVQYRETRPAKGLLSAQVITSAYAIVALPRRDGAVRFEKLEGKS
jgi:hypothetical protein